MRTLGKDSWLGHYLSCHAQALCFCNMQYATHRLREFNASVFLASQPEPFLKAEGYRLARMRWPHVELYEQQNLASSSDKELELVLDVCVSQT